MKKLILAVNLIAAAITTNAITGEEAFASKNWYTITDYCKTNNMNNIQFIFKTNNCSYADAKTILNSNTNKFVVASYYQNMYNYSCCHINTTKIKDSEAINDFWANVYDYDRMSRVKEYMCRITWRITEYNFTHKTGEDYVSKTTNYTDAVTVAEKLNSKIRKPLTTDFFEFIDTNKVSKAEDYSALLTISIHFNNIDGIIDNLIKMNDYSAKQISDIIVPINALDVDYRKADVVRALKNVNSRCTIKLYEDQKTWEPLLAKIRAMISVRQ